MKEIKATISDLLELWNKPYPKDDIIKLSDLNDLEKAIIQKYNKRMYEAVRRGEYRGFLAEAIRLHIRRAIIDNCKDYICKKEIKAGARKIKPGQEVKVLKESYFPGTGTDAYIIQDDRGRKFLINQREFLNFFEPKDKTKEVIFEIEENNPTKDMTKKDNIFPIILSNKFATATIHPSLVIGKEGWWDVTVSYKPTVYKETKLEWPPFKTLYSQTFETLEEVKDYLFSHGFEEKEIDKALQKIKGQTNPNNPTKDMAEKLPKFEGGFEAESYFAGKGYSTVFWQIVELIRQDLPTVRKTTDKAVEQFVEMWNGIVDEFSKDEKYLEEIPSLKVYRPGYVLMRLLAREIAGIKNPVGNPENSGNPLKIEKTVLIEKVKNENPGNPSNPEEFGISDFEKEGRIDLEEFRKFLKADKEKYKKFKEFWEKETGYDFEKYVENEPIIYTWEGLEDEYLALATESGLPEHLEPYLNIDAMISDDQMSGYINEIEIDKNLYYYRTY